MQALIDFDGWRKWKEYAENKNKEDPTKKAAEDKEEKAKAKAAIKAMFSRGPPGTKKEKEKEKDAAAVMPALEKEVAKANGSVKKPGSSSSAGSGYKRQGRTGSSGGSLEIMEEVDEKFEKE